MFSRKLFVLAILVIAALALSVTASAQEEASAFVSDQVVVDDAVVIDSATVSGPAWMVIHADSGEGTPGPVIGHRQLSVGTNTNFAVPIDVRRATPTLFAMLHQDTMQQGVYEFGEVEGADPPILDAAGNVITPSFNAAILSARDKFVGGRSAVIFITDNVVVDAPGWLVIHADEDGGPGPVLGQSPVQPGNSFDVGVSLDSDNLTDVLWPMLHVDTGEEGVYEFGEVEGADGPIVRGGNVATAPVWTVPHARVDSQIIAHGDNLEMGEMMVEPTLVAKSVLSDGPGWLVVHQDADGSPGPVAGFAAVEDGLNENVVVELDPDMLTGTMWPMLHVDTGEVGTYEFGEVEGADGPVAVNDQVVTFPVAAAPSIEYDVTRTSVVELTVAEALIDASGWLVIHQEASGSPGPVLGQTLLTPGQNQNVVVEIDPANLTDTVFPMLHYDTGEIGVYEFGQVEGADGPVQFDGSVVTGPAEVTGGEDLVFCIATVPEGGPNINLRNQPSTEEGVVMGTVQPGGSVAVVGQRDDAEGFTWWRTADGFWVRSDAVSVDADCDVPEM